MLIQLTSGICLPLTDCRLRPVFTVRHVTRLYVSNITDAFHAELTSSAHIDASWTTDPLDASTPARGRGAKQESAEPAYVAVNVDAAVLQLGSKSIGEFVQGLPAEEREFVVSCLRALDKYGSAFRAPASPALADGDPLASLLPSGPAATDGSDYALRYRRRTAKLQEYLREHKRVGASKIGNLTSAYEVIELLKAKNVKVEESSLLAKISELPILRTYSASGIVSFAADDAVRDEPAATAPASHDSFDDEDDAGEQAA